MYIDYCRWFSHWHLGVSQCPGIPGADSRNGTTDLSVNKILLPQRSDTKRWWHQLPVQIPEKSLRINTFSPYAIDWSYTYHLCIIFSPWNLRECGAAITTISPWPFFGAETPRLMTLGWTCRSIPDIARTSLSWDANSSSRHGWLRDAPPICTDSECTNFKL